MSTDAARSFDRRRFLVLGGTSVSLAGLLAACAGTTEEIPVSGSVDQPDTPTQPPITNAVYLRTSSSVVHNAIDSYGTLLGLGVLSAEDEALVRYIVDQQTEQAKLLEEATSAVGGEPYDSPNPAVAEDIVKPALEAMDKAGNEPQDVLRYVNAFESLVGATLQGFVPNVTVPDPRELMMKIAAVDNRHSAVVTSRIKDFTILAPENIIAVTTTTTTTPPTTTTAPGGSAAPPPATPLPVAQVPGPYASLAAVEVVLGGEDFTWETPGPNSYVYEETAISAP
jgi:Ferritin-like domain